MIDLNKLKVGELVNTSRYDLFYVLCDLSHRSDLKNGFHTVIGVTGIIYADKDYILTGDKSNHWVRIVLNKRLEQ
jgi:hypothetical protein